MCDSMKMMLPSGLVPRLLLCGAICLGLLGLRFLWLEPGGAIPLQDALGYGIVLFSFSCWCFLGWRCWWQLRHN